MDGVTVRSATPADAAFLLDLARAAYAEVVALQFGGWNEAVHGVRFAEKIATMPFQVVEVDGTAVGTVASSVHADHVRIDEIVVLPTSQSRGLGSYLMQREIDRASELKLPVRLRTMSRNRALGFYERLGFQITSRGDAYIELERAPG